MKYLCFFYVKFRHSEKATNIRKNLPVVLTLLSKYQQNKREIYSNFAAFTQFLNFNCIFCISWDQQKITEATLLRS